MKFRIMDGNGSDVLGGAVGIANAQLLSSSPVPGTYLCDVPLAQLPLNETVVRQFNLSNKGTYYVERVE